jgi:hypothetical protein
MLNRAQAWIWWFARNPQALAAWGSSKDRWPQHSVACWQARVDGVEQVPCGDCWCHEADETQGDGTVAAV